MNHCVGRLAGLFRIIPGGRRPGPRKKTRPGLKKRFRQGQGFTALETLVGLGIFIVIVTPVLLLSQGGSRSQVMSDQRLRAKLLAEEGLEAVRGMRDSDWDLLNAGSHGLTRTPSGWAFSGSSDITDIFERKIIITDTAPDERQVVSQVEWPAGGSDLRQIALETVLTDWRGPLASGTVTLNIGQTGNDIAKAGNYVYLAVDDDDRGLVVVDVSNVQNPAETAALNLGERGEHIFIDGNYAYVPLNEEKIAIIDISDPLNPRHVSSIFLSAKPNDLFVEDGWAYIGQNNRRRGLVIYNVADPLTPWFYRSYNIGNRVVYDVRTHGPWIYMTINAGRGFEIANELAYVAIDSETQGFQIYDLNINLLSALDVNGAGTRVDVSGTDVYLGVKNITQGVVKIDAANPGAPVVVNGQDIGGSGNGLDKDGGYVYAAVENSGQGFALYSAP